MAIEDSYNFRRVNTQITTSGVVGTRRLKELAQEGYEIVINLLPNDSDDATENERQLVENQGIKYIYIPVDFKHPNLSNYDQFINALDEVKQSKVHIHCAANYRVSAFYSLYAQSRGLWDASQAQSFVQGIWAPQDYPGWPGFIAEVRKRDFK